MHDVDEGAFTGEVSPKHACSFECPIRHPRPF